MKRPSVVLLITASAFLLFAAYGFFRPQAIEWPLRLSLPAGATPGELRAYYGDFELGFGVFLGIAAFQTKFREAAHLAAFCTLGFIALGRVWWMSRAGDINWIFVLSALSELAFAVANLWAFYRLKSLARRPAER